MKKVNYLWQNVILILSFILFPSCINFEKEIEKPMAAFTVTIPGGTVQLSGNPILIVGTTDTQSVIDHRLLCKVTCTDGSIDGGPWTDSIAPLNGSSTFDISEIVNTEFAYTFNTSTLAANRYYERDALAADITVEIGETYIDGNGDLQTVWNTDPASVITILKGKLTRHEFNVLVENNQSFYSVFINGDKWLTRLEKDATTRLPEVTVSSITDEVKAWFAVGSAKSYTFRSITYFSDGTYLSYTDPTTHTCTAGKIYELDLQKYISNPDAKTVIKYSVNIVGTDRIYTVIVDNKYQENHNVLYFANSVGAVEIVHCYGEFVETITTKGETVTSDNNTFAIKTHTIKLVGASSNTSWKINTGFKSLQERRWLKDLLNSSNVWLKIENPLILDANDVNLLPVIIVPGSYTINDSSEDLMPIEFEVRIAHEY